MPLFSRRAGAAPAPVAAVRCATPLPADAERVEVRTQAELAEAVGRGLVPVLVAADDFYVGEGVLVGARGSSRLHAVGDARVEASETAAVTASDTVDVVAHDAVLLTLLGRSRARLHGRSTAAVPPPTLTVDFPDGSAHAAATVDLVLHDTAYVDTSAPGSVTLTGAAAGLVKNDAPTRVTVRDVADLQVASSLAEVVAADRAYVRVSAGRVAAHDRAVVVVLASDADRPAPEVSAAGGATVVTDRPGAGSGGRLLAPADLRDATTWADLWALRRRDGLVEVFVGVRPDSGAVKAPGFRQVVLAAGDTVPAGLPVVTRPGLLSDHMRGSVRVLSVWVPLEAVTPADTLDRAHAATVSEGTVAADES